MKEEKAKAKAEQRALKTGSSQQSDVEKIQKKKKKTKKDAPEEDDFEV